MPELAIDFDPLTHVYRVNGAKVPSVSRVIREAGLAPDLSQIPPAVLEQARRRGMAVHRIAELIDLGEMDPDVEPGLEAYAEAYRTFLRESQYQTLHTELAVAHADEQYAGRLDALGWLGSARVVIDRKATAAIDPVATPVQLAAYAGAYMHMHPDEPIDAIYVLHLRRDGLYQLQPFDFEHAWETWRMALGIFRWKHRQRRQHG